MSRVTLKQLDGKSKRWGHRYANQTLLSFLPETVTWPRFRRARLTKEALKLCRSKKPAAIYLNLSQECI